MMSMYLPCPIHWLLAVYIVVSSAPIWAISICPDSLWSAQQEFLTNHYLSSKYHLDDEVVHTSGKAVDMLERRFPQKFGGLVIVGGLVNGSYMLRKMEKEAKPKSWYSRLVGQPKGTDVDFYLIVNGANPVELIQMAGVVATEFSQIGIPTDGALNGRNPDNAFDIQKIDQYLLESDYSKLSRPFRYALGEKVEAIKALVAEAVKSQGMSETIWDQIRFYHDSPLALYHGTFDQEFIDFVSEKYLPIKIERFGLPRLEDFIQKPR